MTGSKNRQNNHWTTTKPHRCMTDEQMVQLVAGLVPLARAEELMSDVEGCVDCREALAEAGIAIQGNTRSSTVGQPLEPGSLIAERYEVVRFIGRGGMGEVYDVLDRLLSERIALKRIRAEFCDDPSVVGRFKQELRLARKVVHPNVCRVFELGSCTSSGDGSGYYHTMELVHGQSLSTWLRQQPELERVLLVMAQLAAGLSAIHGCGIIHRDFKPDNIMIGGTDSLHATILDFGIAKPLERLNGLLTTAQGVRLGTPDYMAPELLAATASSTASDVYSFGLVSYEMLTGNHPCPQRQTRAVLSTLGELRVARPESHRPEIPDGLSQLVMDCLADDPLCRPATGRELVRRLGEAQASLSHRDVLQRVSE